MNELSEVEVQEQETFVLVHGAFHGGWCWQRVVKLLEQQRHCVYALTLTGLAEKSHLLNADVNLSTHIDDVVSEILRKDLNNIVLCGHSYGGMVVTGVVERVPERIKSVVYLDAFVPQDGESAAELCTGALLPHDMLSIPPLPAEHFGVNEVDCEWVDSNMTPHPTASYNEKISVSGALAQIPQKTYVRAKRFPSSFFDQAYERVSQDSNWHLLSIEAGHDLMIDSPNQVAVILMDAAKN